MSIPMPDQEEICGAEVVGGVQGWLRGSGMMVMGRPCLRCVGVWDKPETCGSFPTSSSVLGGLPWPGTSVEFTEDWDEIRPRGNDDENNGLSVKRL